jgi:AAA domain/DnaB-like helicase N terminal domain
MKRCVSMTDALERALPTAPDAERAVLACILIDGGKDMLPLVAELISQNDFTSARHRALWEGMRAVYNVTGSVDGVVLHEHFRKTGTLDSVGSWSDVSGLTDPLPDMTKVETYARLVRDATIQRATITGLGRALQDVANGTPATNLVSMLSRLQQETATKRETPSAMTLAEFFAQPATSAEWLAEGLVPEGGIVMFAGKPKAGKTSLVLDLAVCVARGEPFLGRHVKPGRVLLLELEEHPNRLREKLQRMGLSGEEEVFVHVGSAPVTDPLTWLSYLIATYQPTLTVIDPVLKLLRVKDANAYSEVSLACEPLSTIARGTGCALALVHHANKSGEGGDSVLGSQSLLGLVDTVFLLKRHEDVRTVSTMQRYGTDMEETVLDMDGDTGLIGIAGSFSEIRVEGVMHQICEAARKSSMPMTESEIREAVGGDRAVVAKAIRQAAETRRVIRTGEGRRGSPFLYAFRHVEKVAV